MGGDRDISELGVLNCMKFEVVGEITNVETIAQGNAIRDLSLLKNSMDLEIGERRKV